MEWDISKLVGEGVNGRSRPVWARGLKLCLSFVGALSIGVAPRVGAWIETKSVYFITLTYKSRPVWARGLKPQKVTDGKTLVRSRPVWARGLKLLVYFRLVLILGRAPCGRVD